MAYQHFELEKQHLSSFPIIGRTKLARFLQVSISILVWFDLQTPTRMNQKTGSFHCYIAALSNPEAKKLYHVYTKNCRTAFLVRAKVVPRMICMSWKAETNCNSPFLGLEFHKKFTMSVILIVFSSSSIQHKYKNTGLWFTLKRDDQYHNRNVMFKHQ
ncbi:hypothetical protein BDF20DRAFT_984101 [Mycotypha africana]|uniref:uncharacterized protein n=1 Tax=Mycotypha africana TaxID=64632 RepID=UPI0022FFC7A1|nr:uncharacterized protein BDF20DRAFT_984101 [Mycotypha africana]KAI8991444.1 hypothetical protein BDF20DRAFT_984101 [Mycotypha africana]